MNELKECPFCGSKAYSVMLQGETWIKCNCGVRFSARPYKDEVARTWNRRPVEDELNAKIIELQNELDVFTSALVNVRNIIDVASVKYCQKLLCDAKKRQEEKSK